MREAERPLANPKMREAESCNVRVLARFRPLSEREPAVELAVDASARRVELTADGVREAFTLDRVFGTEATQREVYENAAAPLAADICAGFNATLMAYGQTGSGKTFTMYGPCAAGELPEPSAAGILPRVTAQVFDAIRADTRGASFSIGASYLEVYREKVRDLLNPNPHADAAGLKISESLERGVFVKGATTVYVGCEGEVLDLLRLGSASRAVGATLMNAASSRSHSLFALTVTATLPDGSSVSGLLHAVDLAGCEKVAKTGASGETLLEAQQINRSLSALGNVIAALADGKPHVPYRDSKLTRLLTESLGGNAKTTLLVACSPARAHLPETLSTLRFAARAKRIANSVRANCQESAATLAAINAALRAQVDSLAAELRAAHGAPAGCARAPAARTEAERDGGRAEAVVAAARADAAARRLLEGALDEKAAQLDEARDAAEVAGAEADALRGALARALASLAAAEAASAQLEVGAAALAAELTEAELQGAVRAQRDALRLGEQAAAVAALSAALGEQPARGARGAEGAADNSGDVAGGGCADGRASAPQRLLTALAATRAELASTYRANLSLSLQLEGAAHTAAELTSAGAAARAAEAREARAVAEACALRLRCAALESRVAAAEAASEEAMHAVAAVVSPAHDRGGAGEHEEEAGGGRGAPASAEAHRHAAGGRRGCAGLSWLRQHGGSPAYAGNVVRPAPIGPSGGSQWLLSLTGAAPALDVPAGAFAALENFGQHLLSSRGKPRAGRQPEGQAGAEADSVLPSPLRRRATAAEAEAQAAASAPGSPRASPRGSPRVSGATPPRTPSSRAATPTAGAGRATPVSQRAALGNGTAGSVPVTPPSARWAELPPSTPPPDSAGSASLRARLFASQARAQALASAVDGHAREAASAQRLVAQLEAAAAEAAQERAAGVARPAGGGGACPPLSVAPPAELAEGARAAAADGIVGRGAPSPLGKRYAALAVPLGFCEAFAESEAAAQAEAAREEAAEARAGAAADPASAAATDAAAGAASDGRPLPTGGEGDGTAQLEPPRGAANAAAAGDAARAAELGRARQALGAALEDCCAAEAREAAATARAQSAEEATALAAELADAHERRIAELEAGLQGKEPLASTAAKAGGAENTPGAANAQPGGGERRAKAKGTTTSLAASRARLGARK